MDSIFCDNIMETLDIGNAEEIIRYLREQRHDYMNHIQVIWGYLQLNRPEKAADYISGMNSKLQVLGKVLKINSPLLALFLYNTICKVQSMGMNVEINADSIEFEHYFSLHTCEKLKIIKISFDTVIDRTMHMENQKEMYIDIYIKRGVLYMQISNNKTLYIDDNNTSSEAVSYEFTENKDLSSFCTVKIQDTGTGILHNISVKP